VVRHNPSLNRTGSGCKPRRSCCHTTEKREILQVLNEKGVRDQLASVREALCKLDAEREALRGIEASLSRWLDLHAGPTDNAQLSLVPAKTSNGSIRRRGMVHGSIPLAEAIVKALTAKAGSTMETREILAAAQAMGAKTTSKSPEKVVEWTIYDLQKKQKAPIERDGPHRYRLPLRAIDD